MTENLRERLKAYKAIANETRLTILLEVSKKEEGLPFVKLRQKLKLNPNALDYHLGKLTNAGLVVNVPRTPATKRAKRSEVLHFMTLSTMPKKGKVSQEKTRYYSYYKVTATGKEILKKLGVGSKTLKE